MTLLQAEVDFGHMGSERRRRLARALAAEDAGALLLLGQANVAYATGAPVLQADAGRGAVERVVALWVADEEWPHLFTPWPEDVSREYPQDHLHGPLFPEAPWGAAEALGWLRRLAHRPPGRVLVDEMPSALYQAWRSEPEAAAWADASGLLASVRLIKSKGEIACIERAQRINEAAMDEVRELLGPGARPAELTSAFLGRAMDLGAEACVVEPIFQPVARRLSDGPRTWAGEAAFPLADRGRPYRRGEVVWVDSGVSYGGYHSDFGRTWVVGEAPDGALRSLFRRWLEVLEAVAGEIRPGASGRRLTEAARRAASASGGGRPWLAHLYLVHGIGMSSAEAPLLGTDLGDEHDGAVVLEPGMVLVAEPVVFEDGGGGYRAEELFAVTDDGCRQLTRHGYEPFR
jgi:Xaa-Pro dipeptidase